ncbi:MAG: alpha/beta hydrolase [Bryobacterales bacterium]|nr:alpha/beta hydrolase [Bryobacterales bacterium]
MRRRKTAKGTVTGREFVVLTRGVLDGWQNTRGPNRQVLIFVHGFLGSTEATWRARQSNVSFPELVAGDPQFESYDVLRFQYKTGLLGGADPEHVARLLRNELDGRLKHCDVVLVAHSMGGLVSMQYVVQTLIDGQTPRVRGLVMYGTPTTGLEALRLARMALPLGAGIAKWVWPVVLVLKWLLSRHKQLASLEGACTFLEKLHGYWIQRVVNGGDPALDAQQRAWIPVRVVTGNEDWVVGERSAKGVYGEIDWCPLDYDHRALVKPEATDDPRYQRLAEFLHQIEFQKAPAVLTQLRRESDRIWAHRCDRCIYDWEFEIHFPDPQDRQSPEPLPGCATLEIKRCSYRLRLDQDILTLAFALGRVPLDTLLPRKPFFIHGIRADKMSEREQEVVLPALQNLLNTPDVAWQRFFQDVSLRLLTADGVAVPLEVKPEKKTGNGYIAAEFHLPTGQKRVLGQEVKLEFSCRSIRPAALQTYTVAYPWMTIGSNVQVVVHGPLDYIVPSPFFLGKPGSVHLEEYGRQHTVHIHTQDLVLPRSKVQVHWRHRTEGVIEPARAAVAVAAVPQEEQRS